MALIAHDNGSDFMIVPQGLHMARCYRVIDLGTQRQEWSGKERWSRKILIQWEIYGTDDDGQPLETDDGRPLSVSKRYTLSLSEGANLRQDLKAWRGREFTPDELSGFDVKNLLSVPCMLNVTHADRNGKTYANVASVSPVPKEMRDKLSAQINISQLYDISDPDDEVFNSLSDRLQDVINSSRERLKVSTNRVARESSQTTPQTYAELENDIPF